MTKADFKTPFTIGNHVFPALWRHILPEEVRWLRFPDERRATCGTCPKVAQGLHHPDTRCCTHFPELPNFLLGFALKDPSCRGLIEKQIRDGHILPMGQQKDPGQYRTTAQTYADDLFGELPSQVCPFLDAETIRCGIYAYRNSVCSTFFCENDHGESGHRFWEKAQDFVAYLEIALAQAAMQALGLDVLDYVSALDTWSDKIPQSYEDEGGWTQDVLKQVWGDWFGREAEFLIACADWVLEHKDELYHLACEQTLYESRALEAAIHHWLPEAIRPKVEHVILDSTVPVPSPIDGFRYQLDLAARQIWEIPFGRGSWVLSSRAVLPEAGGTKVVLQGPTKESPYLELELCPEKLAVLHLFASPQEFNEALMEAEAVEALEDCRGFFAECLRVGLVVEDKGSIVGANSKLPVL